MFAKHTLKNGMRVVAESIPHVRSVALGIWIHAGSERESSQNNGISHFLEHMAFKGTVRRTARQLAESFDEIGGQVNAFTSKEVTCYYAKVLDQHFPIALDILTDMFLHSRFDVEEIEKEKKVITEEIRMVEDTPDDIIHDLLAEASFTGHSLGFPVLGSEENVLRFSRDELLSYRQRQYQPHQVVIAIAGHLPADYLARIEEAFADFQGSKMEHEQPKAIFTPQVQVRIKETEQTHMCLGLPGLALDDERIYHLILLNNLIGGNMSSRLFQSIREERGLAYSVFSYHSAHQREGLFTIYAGTAPGQENEVLACIYDVFADLVKHGLHREELAKAKEQLKANLMLGLESTNNRMSRLGRNEILLGKQISLDEVVTMVESITLEQVNHLAKEILEVPHSFAIISSEGELPTALRRS